MKNFYLYYSEDKGILNREIEKLKSELSVNDDDVINYNIDNPIDIVNDALTISMFSLNKFIIIDCTSYLSLKKDVDNINILEDYFDNYNSNSYLVFISNSSSIDSKKKIVKLISSKGIVKKIEANDEYINKYVDSYLKDNNFKISEIDKKYFISRCLNDIDNIKNELDKLMLYKINDKIITRDDIALFVEENIDNTVFDLVSSLLKNDNAKALKLYNKFTESGMDSSQIVAIIASQVRLLFQVKRLYNLGKSNDEIAKILEFKSVYRVKYLLSDCYYYTEDDLIKYLSKLADIDRDIKLGKVNGNVYLELFIAKKDM